MSMIHATPEKYGSVITSEVVEIVKNCADQLESRGFRAANELRNAAMEVLSGPRSGRQYKIPGTYSKRKRRDKNTHRFRSGVYYTASAPGEPPANRLGHFREGWQQKVEVTDNGPDKIVHSMIENNQKVGKKGYLLGEILENGTDDGRISPRPYQDAIKQKADGQIKRIFHEPYE